MTRRNVQIQLELEVDDDWVRGSAAIAGGAPRPFYGWIGLVGAIEDLVREQGAAAAPAHPARGSISRSSRSQHGCRHA